MNYIEKHEDYYKKLFRDKDILPSVSGFITGIGASVIYLGLQSNLSSVSLTGGVISILGFCYGLNALDAKYIISHELDDVLNDILEHNSNPQNDVVIDGIN